MEGMVELATGSIIGGIILVLVAEADMEGMEEMLLFGLGAHPRLLHLQAEEDMEEMAVDGA